MSKPIQEYKPGENLRPFVELYWTGSFNSEALGRMSIQVIPNGCVELIVHLTDLHCDLLNSYGWSQSPDYTVIGLYTSPYVVQFSNNVKVFAIRFKPEGIYNIFGIPASAFKESFDDMTNVLGNAFQSFCHRLREEKSTADMIVRAENYLRQKILSTKIELSYINRAAELIRNTKGLKIEDLPGLVYISKRQLERQFKEKVGITPKHYLRITRLNEVQRLLDNNHTLDLTSVAYQCGYFDQSHFINDFKRITGEKPAVFFKGRKRFLANPGLAHYPE